MKEISTAFVKAQSEMSNAVKGSKNPFFKSSYADLNSIREAVLPVLNSHGIAVLQPIVNVEGKNYVKTVLLHESGESMESITEIVYSKANDAQAQGSGISYARRYGLQSFVCIGAEDDDAQGAVKQPTANTETSEQKLNKATTLDELGKIYTSLSFEEKKRTADLKDELKTKLT